jgi:hypothetical protein
MNVIDKILSEWSFRCHDGIVDMHNPTKLSILKEILVEYKILNEDIDDDILNALSNLNPNDPKKQKVLTYLQGGEDEKDQEIEKLRQQVGNSKQEKQSVIKKLINKNIPEKVSRFIVFEASENEQLNELNQLIENGLEKLDKEGSLKSKVGNLTWINDIVSGQSSLGIGKGEILLAVVLKSGKLSEETYGDVEANGENIEVKQSSRSNKGILQGAIISDLGRSNDYKIIWNAKVLNGQSFREKYGFDKLLSTWTPIYTKYKEVPNKDEYVKDLKTVMEESDFTNLDEITRKDFEGTKENFYKKIAYCSVGSYLNSKSLVLMNSNLEYIYLNEDEYKDTILNNPRVYANNAFSPRISYKEEIRDEDEVEKPKKSKVTQEIQNLINKLGKNNFELTKYGLGVKSTIDNTIKNKLINKDFIQKADIALSDGKKYHLLTDKKIKIDDLF